jgi:hypothetical protein
MIKYASQGAVNGALWQVLFSKYGRAVNFQGYQLPLYVVGGALGIGSAVMSDAIHQLVLPKVSANQRIRHIEASILAPSVAGATTLVGAKLIHPDLPNELGQVALFGYAAVAEILGMWVSSNIGDPLIESGYKDNSPW